MAAESSEGPPLMRTRWSNFQFEIDYYEVKNFPIGKHVLSPKFTAGGYDWYLCYLPHGTSLTDKGSHASLFLCLQSEVKAIRVVYTFQVLDKKGKFITIDPPQVVTYTSDIVGLGRDHFIDHNTIEEHYCVNDVLVVSCSIRVLPEPKIVPTYPGGMRDHIEEFWNRKERLDVTFEVEGEHISAHRFMLAARSPVFEAKLFGTMAEAKMECIKIDEMKAEVFKALLHFVYTDYLVIDESIEEDTRYVELLQDVMVAADRYDLHKLTLLCEERLEKNLSVETVVTTLLLADRHSRVELKKKCLEFASNPENFSQVALTEGYMTIMLGSPSLLAELKEEIKCSSHRAKKRRTA